MSGLYAYRDIRVLHLEPTAKCQAACPMCGRNVAGGRTRDNIALDEIDAASFAAWFPKDFLARLKTLSMCGNFGDPIVAADCLPMFETARRASSRLHLSMNTNGSARSEGFWRALADLGVVVRFALDGASAQTHVRYRRQTKFDAILHNAAVFISAGGKAVWDMLVFEHNQHEVAEAEALARKIGFAEFVVKSTNRFGGNRLDVQDASGDVVDVLRPSTRYPNPYLVSKPSSDVLKNCAINCKVAQQKSVYVAASGLVFPCCWLGGTMVNRPGLPDSQNNGPAQGAQMASFFALVDAIGPDNLSLHQTPLPVIVERFLPHFARRWNVGPDRIIKCAQICGKLDVDPILTIPVDVRDLRAGGSAA